MFQTLRGTGLRPRHWGVPARVRMPKGAKPLGKVVTPGAKNAAAPGGKFCPSCLEKM